MSEFIADLEPDEVPVAAEARMMMMGELLAKPAPEPEETPPPDRMTAVSHLADGAATHMNHAVRHFLHVRELAGKLGDDRMDYHLRHQEEHLAESADHLIRLKAALAAYIPAIGTELEQLHAVTQPGAPPVRSLPAGEYLPVITDEQDELRTSAPLPRPARPATSDNYDVVFTRPGGPEPA
jgi:hypothetical protein